MKVVGNVPLGVRDHRAAAAEDQVAGEQGTVAFQPEAQVIRAVAWRVEGGHVERADTHHVLIPQLGITLDGRVMRGGQAFR